ncbi:NAD(P)-dependent oxidoreductase [Clostridia bacterium]|nr:NAD(P)-dependent oxidoreductase [Clostridia bacterium]
MRILVTGANGQLGHDVVVQGKKQGLDIIGVDIEDMDIRDDKQVQKVLKSSNAQAVIHCAAYTAVDAAEDNAELCYQINSEGTKNIARICKELNIKLLYISTDYVFNGEGSDPWQEDDLRDPINTYGKAKCEGELAVEKYLNQYFIVRIAWVFGKNGTNFVKTMLNLAKTKDSISVVSDQIGSPTYTVDLSVLLLEMIQSEHYGHYHVTNEGICSWYEFAVEIFRQAKQEVEVIPIDSSQFPTKAKRPHNSRMSKVKLDKQGFKRLPDWKDALKRYLDECLSD